jgi:ribosomal protein S14
MKKPLLMRSKKRNKIRQYFYRLKYINIYQYRWILKLIIRTSYIGKQIKLLAMFFLIHIINKASISKHKNVCLLSSWIRGVNTFTKLNRLTLRDKAAKLYLPGVMNANW